jgi:hypothetical protein
MTSTGLGLLLVGIALAILILRRSLLASAVGVGQGCLGLAHVAVCRGRVDLAVAIGVTGVAVVIGLAAAAVAVHRRRGIDHVDELRELQG